MVQVSSTVKSIADAFYRATSRQKHYFLLRIKCTNNYYVLDRIEQYGVVLLVVGMDGNDVF